MNVSLLKRTMAAIKKYPANLDMNHWVIVTSQGIPCGCIATFALSVSRPHTDKFEHVMLLTCFCDNLDKEARTLLDITPVQADRLFYVRHWPEPHQRNYCNAKTAEEQAEVVCQRIQLFIDSEGTDVPAAEREALKQDQPKQELVPA